ncbi:baseplate J/gp47 family protein [Paenibacillus sp. CAU 1782]
MVLHEAQTFEAILGRMLDRIPDTIDKREGSIIYDACAPAAAELAQIYMDMELQLRLGFGTTSSGEYLDLRAADFGLTRRPAVAAQRKGSFYNSGNEPFDVPIGSRFSGGGYSYTVSAKLASGQFTLVCDVDGRGGNVYFGELLPLEYIPGLARAVLGELLIPGEDRESDESLRTRYLHRVRNPSSGGNAADYRDWAMSVSGVGDAKVNSLWDGPGTVKVIIVDSNKASASPALVAETMEYIETLRPIGASVTVVSATTAPVVVSARIILGAGYSLQAVTDDFTGALEAHFRSIAFAASYVSIAAIGVLLLSVPGVQDYSGLTLNGGTGNVPLSDHDIPALANVELEV